MQPRVWAVIVTYNGAAWIESCLASLDGEPLAGVIVVDNGSTDDTVERVGRLRADAVVHRQGRNLGFGTASNIGIADALSRGADFVLLLNQDLTLCEGCVGRLTRAACNLPTFGLLSAIQLTYDGSAVDAKFVGHVPAQLWKDLLDGTPRLVYEADFMPATAVLVSAAALRDVGGFDPLFFLYGEDDDLNSRMRRRGWSIGVVPGAMVRHWHGLLHCRKSWRFLLGREYSRSILFLKQHPAGAPWAFAALVWRCCKELRLQRVAGMVVAAVGCMMRCRTIHRHRHSTPWRFDATPAAPREELAPNTAATTHAQRELERCA